MELLLAGTMNRSRAGNRSPMTTVAIPRLLIGGTASGVGKTTFVVGLIRALRSRGLKVAAFKCGPDYLDPTYHAHANGSVSHNLDGWMMGRDAVLSTFTHVSADADIAIIEGVMGLYDGAAARGAEGDSCGYLRYLCMLCWLPERRFGSFDTRLRGQLDDPPAQLLTWPPDADWKDGCFDTRQRYVGWEDV